MDILFEYLKTGKWYVLLDLIIIVAITVALLLFFKRRNSLKLAIIYVAYAMLHVALLLVSTFTKQHLFLITTYIMSLGWVFLIVSFCVVYQQDLKATWSKLSKWGDKKQMYNMGANSDDDLRESAIEMVKACQSLSKNDIGALIVIAPGNVPSHVLDTGTFINAQVNSGLLQSIFNTKAPLHDGAAVIKENRILSVGCFLPISQRTDISKELGTRHRAAIGITEESDMVAIVVSEETGVISTVINGNITRYMTPEKLLEFIEAAYGINYIKRSKNKKDKHTIDE